MTATCRSTLRTVAAAISHSAAHGSAVRTRPQCSVPKRGHQLRRALSFTSLYLHTAAYPGAVAAQTGDAQPATEEPASVPKPLSIAERKRALANAKHEQQQLQALRKIPLDKLTRLIAPETYSGDYREAHSLDQALSGVEQWGDKTLAAPALSRETLQHALQRYLADQRVDVAVFLSYRNAMLAKSWPDARRHMIDVDDCRWPRMVLLRAINTVSTPSEISDALALLVASIRPARILDRKGKSPFFKALRHCSATLTRLIIQEDGDALHLLPRSTDLLLALLDKFPAHSELLAESINDFVQRCTGVRDERARQAVTRILDWLGSHSDSDVFENARRKVVAHCIKSIEVSMVSSSDRSASSAQFVDFALMEHLLRQDYAADADLHQRALRCSIFVAGHACNYQRTCQSFDVYQEHKQKHGLAMTGSDYRVLAKALLRSKEGRKQAWRVFMQAEQLWRQEGEKELAGGNDTKMQRFREERKLAHTCIELLDVMAKSADVRLEQVFSMLGIYLEGGDKLDGKPLVQGDGFSEAMLKRRCDVRAYAVVMHGLLTRKRSDCALTVWQAMLQRGVMPNAPALSLLLQNLFQMRNVRSAMQQLHLWCEQGVPKPRLHHHDRLCHIHVPSLSTSELADTNSLLSGPAPTETDPPTKRHTVTPDVVLATVVFSGLHWCGTQGVEALWDAYQLTIQRFPDAPVLAMLLKACCPDSAAPTIDVTFGREVFRSLLFRKHPHLAEYRNPLHKRLESSRGATAGWIFSDNTVGSRMEEWIGSVFQPKRSASAHLPVDAGDPSSLVFTSKLFEHYLRLILHLHHSSGAEQGARAARQELIDVLGWMKQLHVTPSETHVALTVLEIEEHLPPAVAARQMDALEAWLVNWLGEGAMPEATVMQRHWQWKVQRNGQRKGWFDRVARWKQEQQQEGE